MKNLLWLDNIRNPYLNEGGKVPRDKQYNINWVLNYDQFVKWIELYGLPDAISFEHDLADEHCIPEYFWSNYEESKKFQEWNEKSYKEKTGMDCAKWLVNYCMDNKKKIPKVLVHSSNPVGADNIKNLFSNFRITANDKKLLCLVNDFNFLTKDKIYEMVEEPDEHYVVIDDFGERRLLWREYFKEIGKMQIVKM